MDITASISRFAIKLGIETCLEFNPELLVPEQRIRDFCSENRCGNYDNNYMCPPNNGSLAEIEERLKGFQKGVLLQYSKPVNVRNDRKGVEQSKIDFHNKVLQLEGFLKGEGIERIWGMMGGSCALCEVCKAESGEPCPYPDRARTSLESMAIDVLSLLRKFGLDNGFYPDKITWTGCILF
ncbi:DUF2284 domain-containing protein [Chloroflexota bacterium]